MRKQRRFNAHYGGESGSIFIYDYDRKYIIDLKKGKVKKFYGKEERTVSTDIEAYKTETAQSEVEKLRTEAIGVNPEDHVGFVVDYVKSLIRRGDKKTISVADIIAWCSQHGITEEEVRKGVSILSQKGEIFMMDRNTLSSIHLFK